MSMTEIATKPRCFLIEASEKYDVSTVPVYGTISVLLTEVDKGAAWHPSYCTEILAACEREEFDPERDYLVCAGPNMALFIGAATIARKYGPFKVLFWDGWKKRFDEHLVDLGEA